MLSAGHRQRGAAMLIVLLITAIASVVALSISERLALDLARTETILLGVRGNELSAGLETLAGRLLREDNKHENDYDYSGSPWADPLPGLPVPGGLVTGSMQSLDGHFNVNSLLDNDTGLRDELAYEQCQRLLAALDLPVSIADALVDWQDADSRARPQGAEDEYYRQGNPGYLTANQAFRHITELRLVAGITAEVYQQLTAHMAVFPVSQNKGRQINVNLASIPVLQSIDASIDSQLAAVLHQQGRARFTSLDEFFRQALPNLAPAAHNKLRPLLSVRSDFFLARADVLLNDKPQRYYALLERTGNSYDVHYRSFATP